MVERRSEKERIVILGGGMGGLAAAFGLTEQPGWQDRYEITVYQEGFLLGGKGASVRNLARHGRIEEHGLHVWLGFYENAFRLIRRCYEELGRPPGAPLATWAEAFQKHSFVVHQEETKNGFRHWRFDFPENDAVPGDGGPLPSGAAYVGMLLHYLVNLLAEWNTSNSAYYGGRRERLREITRDLQIIQASWEIVVSSLATSVGIASRQVGKRALSWLPERLGRLVRKLWNIAEAEVTRDDNVRRLWFYSDFILTTVVGMIRDDLLGEEPDWSSLDPLDFRAWLKKHGASDITTNAAPVRGLYDLAFAIPEGGAAGVALYGTLRMFLTYKGAIFYKMRAGMGEAVIAPLYLVLRRRGVKFRFFHRVERLALTRDGSAIAAVHLFRQATLRNGGEYQPLIDMDGLPCWPRVPLVDQLVEGAVLREREINFDSSRQDWPRVEELALQFRRDFDKVVLAIPLGALPPICADLAAASPRWANMLSRIGTTRTVAMQLWFWKDLAELGWRMPSPLVGTYVRPFETYCDMSHLLRQERWQTENGARSIAYFCGIYGRAEDASPENSAEREEARARLRELVVEWLGANTGHLFPDATQPPGGTGLSWRLLHDDEGRLGESRIDAQYLRVNDEPSERYVLSQPGTTRYRLPAADSGFDNLLLAGDWTRTPINAGCIEAAVFSGMQASRAISGYPAAVFGERKRPPSPALEKSRLPRYVERPSEIAPNQPFLLTGVKLYGFVLRADRHKLQALVDRDLNEPAFGSVDYVAAAPFVLFACALAARSGSMHSVDREKGTMSEIDLAFWVPVLGMERRAGIRVPDRLVWLMPFVYVDSAPAMVAGREIYGFPKQVADFDIQTDEGGLASLSASAHVLRTFQPSCEATKQEILAVRREGGPQSGRLEELWTSAEQMFEAALRRRFDEALPGLPIDRLLKPLLTEEVRLVFLKQFRDVAGDGRACYQAIVEAPARTRAYRAGGRLKGRYRVVWNDFASAPFTGTLGLTPASEEPVFAFWVDFDFSMDPGVEIWRAPT